MNYKVEYRTMGGSAHQWEGEAADESDAECKALDSSFEGHDCDAYWHSLIRVEAQYAPFSAEADALPTAKLEL